MGIAALNPRLHKRQSPPGISHHSPRKSPPNIPQTPPPLPHAHHIPTNTTRPFPTNTTNHIPTHTTPNIPQTPHPYKPRTPRTRTFPAGDNPTCSRGLSAAIPTVPVQHLIRFRRNHLHKQRIPDGNTNPLTHTRGYRCAQPTATQKTIPSGDIPPHTMQIPTQHPTNTGTPLPLRGHPTSHHANPHPTSHPHKHHKPQTNISHKPIPPTAIYAPHRASFSCRGI